MKINNKEELRQYFENEFEISEVARLSYQNYNPQFTDGVVQLDLDSGELFGASFTQGTLENPENPFVEIWRTSQLEDFSLICQFCSRYEECYSSDDSLVDEQQYIECCEDSIYEEVLEHLEEVEASAFEQAERYF